MISKNLEKAINEQINKELYSEYLYMAMAAYLDANDLDGFAHFFKMQGDEERFHAMKLYNFLDERGGRIILKAIEKPDHEFDSVIDIFEKAYKHEQYVTKLINNLMDLAIKENDHATKSMLDWFVDEQVEEEASMEHLLNKLKMIGGKGNGMLMLDKELGTRTFTPEEE
ncbi:MAG: ferritin [Candidatus Cloacimonetes bacterium]|nr:ferritin [Candidatus Cloacimonadota bacterium]MBS3767897.1 ferritin [Candidatus Cloacimonadota bacterium]